MESVFIIILLLSIACPSLGEEYYVVAEGGGSCPNGSPVMCRDLSYYVNQSEVYFTSNTTLMFLQGTHVLDQDGPVVITGVTNLTLQGLGALEDGMDWETSAIISCDNHTSGLLFKEFHGVTLSRITLTGCGFYLTNETESYVFDGIYTAIIYDWESFIFDVSFSVLFVNGTNVLINDSSIQNGTGYGLAAVNSYGIQIASSLFTRNNYHSDELTRGYGGNIRIVYLESIGCPSYMRSKSIVSITNTTVSFGSSFSRFDFTNYIHYQFTLYSGGLSILSYSLSCSSVSYELDSVNIHNNVGDLGANLLVVGIPISLSINRLNCSYGKAFYGGSGVGIVFGVSPPEEFKLIVTNSVFVGNAPIADNSGTGVAFLLAAFGMDFHDGLILDSCYFTENKGVSILRIERNNVLSTQDLKVNLTNVTFYNNGQLSSNGVYDFVGAVLLINSVCYSNRLNVSNTPYTGIQLVSSLLTFNGDNLIQNNTYTNGGGMVLRGSSTIYFHAPTTVSFVGNRATEFGGAIYVINSQDQTLVRPCFFQFSNQNSSVSVSIIPVNNTANIAGDFLSGGDINVCYITEQVNATLTAFTMLQSIMQLNNSVIPPGFISSSPVGVVYCEPDGSYDYMKRVFVAPVHVSLGGVFNLSVGTLDGFGTLSPGSVLVGVYNCSTGTKSCLKSKNRQLLQTFKYQRPTKSACTNISLVLTGNKYTNSLVLILTTDIRIAYDLYLPLYIAVNSTVCPSGFTKGKTCDCNKYIREKDGTCDINSTSISTDGSVWIGYDTNSSCTLYSHGCRDDHCINANTTFNIIESPNLQCASHRSGVLCGQCAEGYSLLLGSNECGLCHNDNHLSLLLVFGVAGVALVVLLIVLNLTVSVGTINGLVFYANIVKINEDILFKYDPSRPYVLRQFISFINLDLGLPSCFYNGMTPYVKAWLQFVFPLYIWLIMIVIMLLSRQFTKFSKLFGNNVVKVFATLLLLSYTKIIRAIGVALASGTVFCDDNRRVVWSFDGSISFGDPKHVILFVFGLVFLVCLVLPYTLLLISLPFVDRVFSFIRCKFLFLKPFTDAYGAPFTKDHQYWPGLLLIIRILLTIANHTADADTALYLTVFSVLLLLCVGYNITGPYQNKYLNVLECLCLVDLLTLFTLALGQSNESVIVGAIISVVLALIAFVGVIAFHMSRFHMNKLLTLVKKICRNGRSIFGNGKRNLSNVGDDFEMDDDLVETQYHVNPMKGDFSKFRDSILNDFDS